MDVTSGYAGLNNYVAKIFDADIDYTIQSGDYLVFDVYIINPEAVKRGGLDGFIVCSGTWYRISEASNWVDQNGL